MRAEKKRSSNRIKMHKAFAVILVAAVMAFSLSAPAKVSAASSSKVKIGHAVSGEKGLKGNKPGDQTGSEVRIEDWSYSIFGTSRSHWKYVLRAKDHDLARAIAKHMTEICDNEKIGYDQNDPDCITLYDEAKAKGWDIKAIKKKCETTCSDAVSVCLNAEGVKVPKRWNSSKMKKDLLETDLFECLDTKDYAQSSKKLVPGDILIAPGRHTAVVIESDNPFTYKLTYSNAGGETIDMRLEEGVYITINPNNSNEPSRVKMDSDIDMTNEKAVLAGHIFVGWEKTGTRTLTACYKPERQIMRIKTDKVKI